MAERVTINIDNHIADVRLNRPDKMNALDRDMFAAIIAAQAELAVASGIRVVVLSGVGRAFCAGLDLSAMTAQGGEASPGSEEGAVAARKLETRTYGNTNLFQEAAMGWRKLPAPVIAAVHGVCFGGGLQIASGADMRVVTPDARLSVMEMRWGLIPDMAGFALWRSLVRDDVLREMTYTNREFDGREALELGFATRVDADPHARAMSIALEIAGKHPAAVQEAKHLINDLPDIDSDAILMAESRGQDRIIRTPDQVEAVMAALEKRAPKFLE